jgi:hypothetical protein
MVKVLNRQMELVKGYGVQSPVGAKKKKKWWQKKKKELWKRKKMVWKEVMSHLF